MWQSWHFGSSTDSRWECISERGRQPGSEVGKAVAGKAVAKSIELVAWRVFMKGGRAMDNTLVSKSGGMEMERWWKMR